MVSNVPNNGPSKAQQERAQMQREHDARKAARQESKENYNKKVDEAADKSKKAVDEKRAAKEAKKHERNSKANQLFEKAKIDTRRSGDYSKMKSRDILGDMCRRAIGSLHNFRVSVLQSGAKGLNRAFDFVNGIRRNINDGISKAYYNAKATVKKATKAVISGAAQKLDDVSTLCKKGWNKAKSFAHNIGSGFKRLWARS